MENYLTNEAGKTGIAIDNLGDIVILNFGEEVYLLDMVSVWQIIEGIKKQKEKKLFIAV